MQYEITEHVNSKGATRRGERKQRMGKDGVPFVPTIITYTYRRAEPRAIDLLRKFRAEKKESKLERARIGLSQVAPNYLPTA